MPASLPDNAIAVRVCDTPSYFCTPEHEVMPWDKPVIPRLVVRYRYLTRPGGHEYYLCEDCHRGRVRASSG